MLLGKSDGNSNWKNIQGLEGKHELVSGNSLEMTLGNDTRKVKTSPLVGKHKLDLGEELTRELQKSPVLRSLARENDNKTSEAGKTRFLGLLLLHRCVHHAN